MTEPDKSKFGLILVYLGEIYQRKLSKGLIGIYWEALKPYSLEQIEAATTNIVRRKSFNRFPVPAEFIEFIDPPENLDARAAIAFAAVDEMFTDNGYGSVVFDDPLIHHVLQNMGGWIQVCADTAQMDEKEFRFWRKDFERLYRAFAASPPNRPVPRLIGTHEQHNRFKGYLDDNDVLRLPGGQKVQMNYLIEFEQKHGRIQIGTERQPGGFTRIGEIKTLPPEEKKKRSKKEISEY